MLALLSSTAAFFSSQQRRLCALLKSTPTMPSIPERAPTRERRCTRAEVQNDDMLVDDWVVVMDHHQATHAPIVVDGNQDADPEIQKAVALIFGHAPAGQDADPEI